MKPAALRAFCISLFASTLLVFGLASTVQAQASNGNISGDAVAGDTVIAINADTGLQREIQVKKDGKYRMRALPLGTYVVTIKHADGTFGPSSTVTLRVGATAFIPGAKPDTTPPPTP